MSKDQNPSDKACDAYFDNPYTATSGSYYSDRVTFYAGFAAGAASRNAELVEAQATLLTMRDSIWEALQQRDKLCAEVEILKQDAERLEWMFAHSDAVICSEGAYGPYYIWFRYSNRVSTTAKTAREAIDAAMKGEK